MKDASGIACEEAELPIYSNFPQCFSNAAASIQRRLGWSCATRRRAKPIRGLQKLFEDAKGKSLEPQVQADTVVLHVNGLDRTLQIEARLNARRAA